MHFIMAGHHLLSLIEVSRRNENLLDFRRSFIGNVLGKQTSIAIYCDQLLLLSFIEVCQYLI